MEAQMNPTLRSLLQLNELDQEQTRTHDKERQTKPLPKTVLRTDEERRREKREPRSPKETR
jgi:hypothetical protein